MASHRRVRKESDELLYTIRSLVTVRNRLSRRNWLKSTPFSRLQNAPNGQKLQILIISNGSRTDGSIVKMFGSILPRRMNGMIFEGNARRIDHERQRRNVEASRRVDGGKHRIEKNERERQKQINCSKDRGQDVTSR